MFYVPAASIGKFLLISNISNIFYILYLWCLKMSLALLYLRVFSLRIAVRNLIYALLVVISLTSWVYLLYFILRCHPVSGGWNAGVAASCLSIYPGFVASSVIGICVDVVLIIVVVSCISVLRIRRAQKIGLLIVANLGWVATLASILRAVEVARAFKSKPDLTLTVTKIVLWTGAECSIMLICASAPVIRPLLKKFAGLFPNGWIKDDSTRDEGRPSMGLTGASSSPHNLEVGSGVLVSQSESDRSFTGATAVSESHSEQYQSSRKDNRAI
jgi:hypothetical protein